MKENELVDSQIDIPLQRNESIKKVVVIIIFILVNTLLYGFLIKSERTMAENFIVAVQGYFIGFNVIGFVLGTLFALIHNNNLSYSKRYLQASLITIIAIHAVLFIGLLVIGVLTLLGKY